MASGGLARYNFGEGRFGRTADIHHLGTPRMERASGRNVECASHLAACAQVVIAENPFGVAHMWDRGKECLRVWVRRRSVYLCGSASFNDLPEIHHRYPVRSVANNP